MQKGKYVIIGFYDTTSQTLEWMGNEKFAGGRGPPPDSTIIRHLFVTVNLMLYYSVLFAMMIGLSAAFGLFIFNQKYSYRRIIAQSQPQCNNLLIVGCALCLFSLLLMGLPADEGLAFAEDSFAFLCHTRVSLLMVGFTFAYGSLFAKVWIVHRLGATENQELAAINKEEEDGSPWESIRMLIAAMVGRQALVAAALRKISTHAYGTLIAKRPCRLNQPIPAEKFYSVVGSLFLVDFVIIAFWLAIDPLQRTEQTFHLQGICEKFLLFLAILGAPAGTDEDVMLLPILELCQSSRQEVWIVLVLGYKGLLLVFGLFLAYESRHLKLRYVNDSRFVHLTICNVSVLSLIIGPIVTFFLRHQANAFFGFVSATVLLCTYIGLGLMFLPKIIYIYNTPHSSDDTANTSSFNDNQRSNIFKSDQLRYLQLVKENNELKRQIEIRKIKVTECRRLLGKRLVAAGITTTSATQTPKFNKLVTTASTKESTIATDEGFSSATLGRLSSSNVNGCCSSPSNYSSASSTNVAGFITANGTPMAAATAANTIMTLTGMFHSGSMVDNMNRGVEIEVKEGRSFSCSSAAQSTSSSTSSSEEILL
uniref:G-protein coupled receptors family 3 profile domain-containing protein n=1 Tax=Ditylenchus dipsaci TaxID=166011 RepID=A0A915EEN6_9BILA